MSTHGDDSRHGRFPLVLFWPPAATMGVAALLVIGLSLSGNPISSHWASASGPTYSGRAYGASIAGSVVADTGQLASKGGSLSGFAGIVNLSGSGYSFKAPTVPGAAAMSQIVGVSQAVTATATLLNFQLTLGSVVISADTVQAQAFSPCAASAHGSVFTTGLQVNGAAVFTTGAPNQIITLPSSLGTMTINEQIVAGSSLTVNAIHIHTASGKDDVLSSAQVGLTGCSGSSGSSGSSATPVPTSGTGGCVSCIASTVGGSSYGATLGNTVVAPSAGCNTRGFSGLVSVQGTGYTFKSPTVPGAAAMSNVVCSGQAVTSTATVLNFKLVVGGVTINADTVQGQVIARCGSVPHGQSFITGLQVNGSSMSVPGSNTINGTMPLPNNAGTLTVNEQVVSGSGLTVNALHIRTATSDIVLGSAQGTVVTASSGTCAAHSAAGRNHSSDAALVDRRMLA